MHLTTRDETTAIIPTVTSVVEPIHLSLFDKA